MSPNTLNHKNLLSQLTRLEHTLNNFSFEELTAAEASCLKISFQTFKIKLENKILTPSTVFGVDTISDEIEEENSKPSHVKISNTVNADELVAKVSHEIRTPLNGIIGFTDLLKEDELSIKQLERVNAIQTASYSLMDIINELLEFSKLSAGLTKFESIDFNLNNVVDNVMYLCDTLITDKNISLKTTIDENIPKILIGDPSKLSQILLNLLGNAVKFVESGTIHLDIKLKKQKTELFELEFIVKDTGIGIASDQLEYIFNSYKQAELDTQARFGGTGLGLSIVKQIITNLGGNISVSSQVGVGTTFCFLLEYKKGNISNISKIIERNELLNSSADLESVKDMRILVFEDNIINQKLITQRLKSWQCKTYVTDNAYYGLNLLETNNIDLVLMDLKMPGMNGFEVTELIRKSKIDSVKNIPVIAVSADFTYQDKKQCEANLINDFILKPYSPDELLTKLVKTKNSINKTLPFEPKINNSAREVYADATKINLSVILEDCLGQIDLLEELVTLYKQNALEFIGIVKTNFENEDHSEIKFAAHKIKSGLAMMQSKSLHTIADQIQETCKNSRDKKQLRFLLDRFIEEYSLVEKAIDEQINALKKK